MKIAIIGGGSTYTPELFEGLILRANELGLKEVVLEDIDPDRLGPVSAFCRRMAKNKDAHFAVGDTLELDRALDGADVVVTQIRVGGQKARHSDESIPLKHGLIGQETTGAGGFAKAMRTIPKILEIADAVRRNSPNAWMINFTNPSGIVTEALLRHGGVKAVGLCNIPIEMRIETAKAIGVPMEAVELDYVGLNHLGWVRGVKVAGQDIMDAILAFFTGGEGPKNIPDIAYPPEFFRALRMIPSPYLRYFYATTSVLNELRAQERTRAQVVMELEDKLLGIYRDESQWQKPDLLNERGGTWYSRVALDVIAALHRPEPTRDIVNTLNNGAVPGLPDDASVEIPAMLSNKGVTSVAGPPVPEEAFGLMRQVKAYERLTIEAAMSGSRDKALAALVANPLVREVEKAIAMINELLT